MAQRNNIFVAGSFIAHQSVETQIIGGNHTHHYPAHETAQPRSQRVVEDIDFEDLSARESKANAHTPYPFVVPDKLVVLNLYSLAEFEAMYREAAGKEAPDLALFLKQYQKLHVLDFGRLNKKQIFEVLQRFFADEIRYKYNNFIAYF